MDINNDPENSSSTTVAEHISSGFSMSKMLSFKSIGNRHDVYRGKTFLIKFCKFLREHAKKIISKRKKIKLLTNEKNLKESILQMKNIVTLEIIVIIKENIQVLYIASVI